MDFTGLDLNLIWFVLIGVLFSGYAMLDGFDLGVGALHLFTKSDHDRRIMINSIGPVWDGNEVWLVTGGGALFAAFPDVYATLASGFYLAVMLLLLSLIFRAVAIEFRSKVENPSWRQFWDVAFSMASIVASFVLGVALGNIVWGIPLGADKEYMGGFLNLFNPYALLVGVTTVALFMMHGSIYILLKTEGKFHELARGWINNCIIFFIICYGITTMATLVYLPEMADKLRHYPWLFLVPLVNMLAIANIPREIHHNRDLNALISSCVAMLCLIFIFGGGIFPNIVMSRPNPEFSLTIYNASSSVTSLTYMLTIAIIGIPFVLSYTIAIYWIFRGKVKITKDSY